MKFCMNCMAQYIDEVDVCPECGFIEGTMPDNSRCAEPGSILADRYIVGMPINIDGWFVKYIGWDFLTSRTVTIYEYSPVRFSSRAIGDTRITVIKEKEFFRYMDSFMKKAQVLAEMHLPDNVSAVYETFEKNGTAYVVTEYVKGEPLADQLEKRRALSAEETEKLFLPVIRSLDVLHESGFVIGGFSLYDLLVLEDGTLFLNSYLENILFNVTEDRDDIRQKEKQKYYSPERMNASELRPADDVFSAAMIMYRMMGVKLPDPGARAAYYAKKHKDSLKSLGGYRVRVDKNKENALRNASFIDAAYRTPDMETFIKELSGDRKVNLRSEKNKGFPMWAKIAIPAACCALAAGIAVLIVMNRGSETVTAGSGTEATAVTQELDPGLTAVPSLINLKVSSAESKLSQAGLLIEISGKEINDGIEADTVLSQDREKGSLVGKNTVVGVTVSAKSGLITMPNFLGQESGTVLAALDNLNMKYVVKEEYSRSAEAGCIMRQSVTPYQQISLDTRLELTVSKGRDPAERFEDKPVEVGDYNGKTYDELKGEAEALGTPVKVTGRVYDESRPEGTVVSQYPAPDTRQDSSEPVQVEVTTKNKYVNVPDVTLLEKSKAVSVLEVFGLKAEITEAASDTVAEGLISEQEPAAGTESCEVGSAVKLTVSTGKASVVVPDAFGKRPEEAAQLLVNAGLSPTVVLGASAGAEDGVIIGQSVEAGTELRRGSAVVLTLNSKQALADVPDILGLDAAEARKLLEDAGLNMKVYLSDENSVTDGKVFSQVPFAGLKAVRGGDVTVLLIAVGDSADSGVSGNSLSDDEVSQIYSTEPEGKDIVISPETVSVKAGEEFLLEIKCTGFDDLQKISYELSEQGIIAEKYIDKQSLSMRFRAVAVGNVAVTVSCDGIERICFVEVTE